MKIWMYDERTETIVTSEAELNLKTGEISNVVYTHPHEYFNIHKDELPFDGYEYMGTYAEFPLNGKNIEFKVDTSSSTYLLKGNELTRVQKEVQDLGLDLDSLDAKPKNKLK
jgi:hypothetical protein